MADAAAVLFRKARLEDLRAILELLNDGKVGNVLERIEDPVPRLYTDAFALLDGDPNQRPSDGRRPSAHFLQDHHET